MYPRIIVLVAAALTFAVNCDKVDVTAVDASRVELAPNPTTVAVSQTTRLTATVLSSDGQTLTGRAVVWSSMTENTASVDNTGMVRGVATGVATIRAVSGSATGTATVNVEPAPATALAPTEVTFSAVQNGATPGDRTVNILEFRRRFTLEPDRDHPLRGGKPDRLADCDNGQHHRADHARAQRKPGHDRGRNVHGHRGCCRARTYGHGAAHCAFDRCSTNAGHRAGNNRCRVRGCSGWRRS